MRIVFTLNYLSITAGIETITVTKANALADIPGYEVWIISTYNEPHEFVFWISEKVHAIGLGHRVSWRFPWNLLQLAANRTLLRRLLKKHFRQINPDIVISTGGAEKWVIPSIRGEWVTIREIHNVKGCWKSRHGSFPKRIEASVAEFFDRQFNINRFDRIVVLTPKEKETYWADKEKVCVIPNAVRFRPDNPACLDNKRIIAVGRLEKEKNFSSLINVFSRLAKQFPEWKLDIFGEGSEHHFLRSLIEEKRLSGVVTLKGITSEIEKEFLSSSLLAMTSDYEGFGLVLTEAMSCGLPVVAYDCPSGPGSIITDGEDGFLVPLGDEETLAFQMGRLMKAPVLRKRMGTRAFESSKRYGIERIMKCWMDLFHELLTGD